MKGKIVFKYFGKASRGSVNPAGRSVEWQRDEDPSEAAEKACDALGKALHSFVRGVLFFETPEEFQQFDVAARKGFEVREVRDPGCVTSGAHSVAISPSRTKGPVYNFYGLTRRGEINSGGDRNE